MITYIIISVVSHSDDLYYLFEKGYITPQTMTNQQDIKMRRIMVKLWTNFAIYG